MPVPAAVAAPVAGAIAGKVLGGGGTQVAIPSDMQGLRSGQMQLLQSLLGMGGTGSSGGATKVLGAGTVGNSAGGLKAMGSSDPMTRLQSFFGQMGTPTTSLQRQSINGLEQMLGNASQSQAAWQSALPALQGILGQAPGKGIMDALGPMFQRNLAAADSQGARFGSANAIMRSRAIDDMNLLGAQAAQQGIGQQLQAAQILGMLGQQGDQSALQRLSTAFGIGQADAQQQVSGQQQMQQILQNLLGTAQGAAFNLPFTQSPTGAQQGTALGGQLGQLLILMQAMNQGGAGAAATPTIAAQPTGMLGALGGYGVRL